MSQSHQFHFGFLVLSPSLKDSKNEIHVRQSAGSQGLLDLCAEPGCSQAWRGPGPPAPRWPRSLTSTASRGAWAGAPRRRHMLCNPLDRMQSFKNSCVSPKMLSAHYSLGHFTCGSSL